MYALRIVFMSIASRALLTTVSGRRPSWRSKSRKISTTSSFGPREQKRNLQTFKWFLMVSGQLARTISPQCLDDSPPVSRRLAPESTNITMFLLFVFYRGFLRTIQYYMFLLFTSYKRFSAVLKLKCLNKVYIKYVTVLFQLLSLFFSILWSLQEWVLETKSKYQRNQFKSICIGIHS